MVYRRNGPPVAGGWLPRYAVTPLRIDENINNQAGAWCGSPARGCLPCSFRHPPAQLASAVSYVYADDKAYTLRLFSRSVFQNQGN
ncbi:hypothetical protein THICB2_840006 [Thiomonas sp. CB2]|nr:hypothetical protein THICB2_840006 [Thiomonas sp. CB2]VDY06189.1 protein of unknown function [Thiomonas sp. Bio17B3]VDY10515.1 protein of unknown function [Thiomonas sp. Sup16B3]VDY14453.1 conserved protein of unknown function [Thiomonas sp. OC7]VDY16360.1 protein of unknown function [Thiomonas sp. CB2]